MKHVYYYLLVAVSLIILVPTLASVNAKKELPDKHLEVVLRSIGHQLLLHAKDSSSRVLPVKAINEHIYQIYFEDSFGFTPDTLMRLINEQLAKTDMPKDYIVSVNDCNENKTAFAYEINAVNGDLRPCGGRKQETGCYYIQIEFLAAKPFNYAWLLWALIPIELIGFYLYRRQRKQKHEEQQEKGMVADEASVTVTNKNIVEPLDYKQLGKFRFYDAKGLLCLNDETIELSEKETKALNIFVSNQNLLVERDKLRKEIWEDEGVFVIDRNVDVLVSKLRKKIIGDPSITIINVHGKGYKLVTS